jgi:hypothetical protein
MNDPVIVCFVVEVRNRELLEWLARDDGVRGVIGVSTSFLLQPNRHSGVSYI